MPSPTTTTTTTTTTNTTTAAATALPSWVLEEREAGRIKHRRRVLEQRAQRIHGLPRATSIAVDVEGLSQQVKDRQRASEKDQKEEDDFMRLAATQDRAALLLQHHEKKAEEARRTDLAKFWREEQRPERRRDADLDSHEHLTSALYELRFEGEDLGRNERVKAQQEQAKEWLEQQRREQQYREQQEKKEERRRQLECAEAAEQARQLAQAEEQCRLAEQLALQRYNLALSEERKAAQWEERLARREAEDQEVRNAVLGAFLTEQPTVARSSLGPHRIIPHRWKGMSEAERRHILEVRERQVEEKKRQKEQERREEAAWAVMAKQTDKAALLSLHQEHTNARRREEQLAATNTRLATEQRDNRAASAKLAAPPLPSLDFYRKFGMHPR
ncbi:RIB43A-like with coiled-coils protein 1 [Scylla paramamosain]|uniref:RIB43A-like with coiled-coils protein 1 n=1 Tax=Scylla paramamosain TaxID=85552 RepID=UPI003083A744